MIEWRGGIQDLMLIGGGVAAFGGIVVAARLVWRRGANGIGRVRTFWTRIERIHAELTPNGGRSIKDTVSRIERRMSIMELRYQASLYETAYGVVYTDGAGDVIFANFTFLRLVDRNFDEIRGRGWINAIHERDQDRIVADWEAAVRERRNFESTHSLVSSSGAEIPVRVIAYRLPDEADPKTTVGYFAKITILPRRRQVVSVTKDADRRSRRPARKTDRRS